MQQNHRLRQTPRNSWGALHTGLSKKNVRMPYKAARREYI